MNENKKLSPNVIQELPQDMQHLEFNHTRDNKWYTLDKKKMLGIVLTVEENDLGEQKLIDVNPNKLELTGEMGLRMFKGLSKDGENVKSGAIRYFIILVILTAVISIISSL